MNAGRRTMIKVCVDLIELCLENGVMNESTYVALGEAAALMKKEEYWSLRNMSKHADKNDSTARQVAISELALPLLEKAVLAWQEEDLQDMATHLRNAGEAEPKPTGKKSKKDLVKSKK